MLAAPVIYDGKAIHTLDEYEEARRHRREFDEQKPYAAIFLLADSSLLFWKEEGLEWINRIKCELPTRALCYDGYEADVKASYVGAANDDAPEHFETFKAAMQIIGVEDCVHVHADPSPAERAHLEQSDIVLIAGGELEKGWKALSNLDGSLTYLGESVKWRYYDGAVLVGIAAGATMIGQKGYTMLKEEYQTEKEKRNFFKALGIVPSVVVTGRCDDETTHEIAQQLGPGTVICGVPRGCGCILNTDMSFEPVRGIMSDVHYDYQKGEPNTNLVAPPERGAGILVAVERFRERERRAKELRRAEEEARRAAGVAGGGGADAVDDDDADDAAPVTDAFRAKAAQLKDMGNEAFRRGDTERALELYREAQLSDRADPKICLNIAACLLKQATPDATRDCVAVCNLALRLSAGKAAKAWFRRGLALLQSGQPLQGWCDLHEALILAPGDKEVLREIAIAEEARADHEPFNEAAIGAAVDAARADDDRVLDLAGRGLGPRAVRHVGELLVGDDTVLALRLRGNWMRAAGAEHLARCLHGNTTLAELDVAANALRDRGARDLISDGLLQSTNLAVLRLSFNGISDFFAESLAEVLKDVKSLRVVDLRGNEVGFRGACAFATLLRAHDAIERLDLSAQQPAGLLADSLWRLVSAASQHAAMRELDVRGAAQAQDTLHRLDQRMRHAQCLVRVGRMPEAERRPPKNLPF